MVKKRKFMLLGALVSASLIIGACSDKEASNTPETKETTNNESSKLIMLSGDTVSEQAGCVLASRFTVGEKIVFRMDAKDPETGEQVEDAKLQVHLSTGDVLDMQYAEHPPGVENPAKFWTAAYVVTEDTPTGTLGYHVTAEDGERKGEFSPFNVAPSLLTIVADEVANGQAPAEEAKEPAKETPADIKTNQTIDLVATNFTFNEEAFYVKAGEEVTLNLTSEEGLHGIAIEGLDVSIDDPNGSTKFTPTKPGEYKIACSVFCGAGHADMTANLVVIE